MMNVEAIREATKGLEEVTTKISGILHVCICKICKQSAMNLLITLLVRTLRMGFFFPAFFSYFGVRAEHYRL